MNLMFKRRPAVALGGGGARGFAHIGVLRVLEKAGIPISQIVGTSMGAIVGGLYAQTLDSRLVEEKLKRFLESPIFKNNQSGDTKQKGAGSWLEHIAVTLCDQLRHPEELKQWMQRMNAEMMSTLQELFPHPGFEKCLIPFAAVASDLLSGEEVVQTSGSIVDAVFASAAMPGVFAPVPKGDYLLVDGAATSPVPVRAARALAPRAEIIAVDVSSQLAPSFDEQNVLSVILRSSAVTGMWHHRSLVKEADVLIEPHVKLFSWSEFSDMDDFIAEGEQAALQKLPQIIKAVRSIRLR
jgi:NTE family protein